MTPIRADVVEALIRARLGERFRWSRSFVVFRVAGADAMEHALWRFRLSYDRRRGTPTQELLSRIEARAATLV